MRRTFPSQLGLALFLSASAAVAADDPFLSATYEARWPGQNVVPKGVAVRFEAPVEGEPAPEGPVGGGHHVRRPDSAPPAPEVYKDVRRDFQGYRLNVPNGKYTVTLMLCEERDVKKGEKAFDIEIQGKRVAEKVDLIEKVGRNAPLELSFPDVEVKDGRLTIDLKWNGSIAALAIEGSGYSRKINCGGPARGDFAADWPSEERASDSNSQAGLIFDTDLLRVAAGWAGGDFLRLRGVLFDGAHGPNPSPGGPQRIGTRPTPGWARGSDLNDPRPIPYGPLPRDWARYKGLYRHGDETVFRYEVGRAQALEELGVEVHNRQRVFTRTINLATVSELLTMLVADLDGAKGRIENGLAILESSDRATAARLVGAPEGAEFAIVDGGRIVVKLPASPAEMRYTVGLWGGELKDLGAAAAALGNVGGPKDLGPLTKGGPTRWKETVTLKGTRAKDDAAYVVDDIPVPFKNPYGSPWNIGGFDFFSDGRAAVSTWRGDVWVASGIDDNLEKVSWKRYAAGLFQALGLKIVKDKVYVLGRDQITRLDDLDGDGEADFYACFNNDVMVTSNFHEFALDLNADAEGNFYFAKAGPVRPGGWGWDRITPHHGCLFKIAADGSKLEVVARGFRAPNGMGLGPRGELTVGDNQGTWTPVCPINWIKPGGFYGVPDFAEGDPKPKVRDNPLCWLPYSVDNSNGCQVWITGETFGPLSGQLLHSSYGACTLFAVLKEEVEGQMQGGVAPLPLPFDSGICRARFLEGQNALYLTGLRGWQTRASKDAGFYRVRYTGKPAYLPIGLHVAPETIKITFTEPLDKESAEDVDNYNLQRWNYRWSENYGSPEVMPNDPGKEGREEVDVDQAELSEDGKTVTLTVPDLKPVMQMKVDLKFKAADGRPVQTVIHHTINVVGEKKGRVERNRLNVLGGGE